MKKILSAVAVVAMLASSGAFAGSTVCDRHPNMPGCGGGGGGGETDTGGSNTNDNRNDNSNRNTNTAFGGRGGDGGNGYGVGLGVGKGGDASANSRNRNSNRNIANGGNVRDSGNSRNDNRNLNAQGQMQGQGQGQIGINKSRNDLTNVGYQGQVGINRNGSVAGSIDGNNSDAFNEGNNTAVDASDNSTSSVVYEGDEAQKRNPVSPAWAAPLVASEDTCMGSTSGGGQGITLGFSFATTWRDKDCVIRKDARFLHNANHQTVALGLMCDKERVRKAVAVAGSPAERKACGLNEDGSEPSTKASATSAAPTSPFIDD